MGFKPLVVADDVSNMDGVEVDPGAGDLGQVSGSLRLNAVLTGCVLAGCLAMIAVLAIF